MKKTWLIAVLLFSALVYYSPMVHAADNKDKSPAVIKSGPQKKAVIPQAKGAQIQRGEQRHDFRSARVFNHFTPQEREMWRSGGWRHEMYQGRLGWWWVVGGMWYFYPEPVYVNGVLSYPLVVPALAFEAPFVPAVIAVRPVVQQPVLMVQPQTQQFWYWCDNPKGYSPYVTSCPSDVPGKTGWRKVPAQTSTPSSQTGLVQSYTAPAGNGVADYKSIGDNPGFSGSQADQLSKSQVALPPPP